MNSTRPAPFIDVPRDNPVFQVVMPLLAIGNDGMAWPSGTAFFVAPGLAITALHVLQDFWERLEGGRFDKEAAARLPGPAGFSVVAHQIVDSKHVQWDATRMWAADPLDIAFVEFRSHDGTPLPPSWPVPNLVFSPPAVGESVFAVGFPKQEYREVRKDAFAWRQDPMLASGFVDEVHLQCRDTSRLRWPCFRTNARFDGGMSGGPVVDGEGRVCGVVCSNLPPADPTEEHASYVSLLWPLLAFSFDGLRFIAPPGSTATFADLFSSGCIDSPDWRRVRILDDGKTVTYTADS